jgi:hypothetical protein
MLNKLWDGIKGIFLWIIFIGVVPILYYHASNEWLEIRFSLPEIDKKSEEISYALFMLAYLPVFATLVQVFENYKEATNQAFRIEQKLDELISKLNN